MASYTLTAGQVGAYEKTLVAATADSVTFADDIDTVEVSHDGTAFLYFTVDASVPTVAGAGCWMLPPYPSAISVSVPTSGGTVVKLISAGTPKYSVARGNAAR